MWKTFSEKKGRLWGSWSSPTLGEFQPCVHLTFITSLTPQICLGPAFKGMCVFVRVHTCVYTRETGTHRDSDRETQQELQTQRGRRRETGHPAFSWLLKHPGVCFFYSPVWRPSPCQNPIPSENPAANTGREWSKTVSKGLRQPYLWSESPERFIGRHPAVAGADLRAGKHWLQKNSAGCGNIALEQVSVSSPGDSSGRSRDARRSRPCSAGLENREVWHVAFTQI